jgi:hypothetical protein
MLNKLINIFLAFLAGLGVVFSLYKSGKNQGAIEEKLKQKDSENENLKENLELQKDKIVDVSVADDYLAGLH